MHNYFPTSQVVIYDVEYTAWEGSIQRNWSKPWEHQEIIQLSAISTRVEESLHIQDEFNVFVRPTQNPSLSSYIVELTGIDQRLIETEGVSFPEALERFCDFIGADSGLYSWGGDEEVILANCELYELPTPDFVDRCFDVREYVEALGLKTKGVTSGTAHEHVGIPEFGRDHYALDDVRSILLTLNHLIEKKKLDEGV